MPPIYFMAEKKSLGWKIDYHKLLNYLKSKYGISKALYFGGAEIHKFKFDYLKEDTINIGELEKYLHGIIKEYGFKMNDAMLLLISRHLQRVKFYLKLKNFGYDLYLKPVKLYYQDNETTKRKANCDVDMTFYLMREKDNFDRALILSGDGDFLPVLKYLKSQGKEIIVLARGPRTAREIRRFAGGNFRDFVRLKKDIRFIEK